MWCWYFGDGFSVMESWILKIRQASRVTRLETTSSEHGIPQIYRSGDVCVTLSNEI
jgi:hypothetical protein